MCYFGLMATKTKVPEASTFLHLRIKTKQVDVCKKAAVSLGISLSDFVRMALVEHAKKVQAESK